MGTISEQLATLERPAVVMTIALPGSGKTTLIGEVLKTLESSTPDIDAVVVCPDDIRDGLAGTSTRQAEYDPALNAEVFEIANDRVRAILDIGGIAIIDATHLSRNPNSTFREKAIATYRKLGARTIAALVLDVPIDVAKGRNEARGIEGEGYVKPADIDSMESYRQQHLVTPDAPGEFDVVML